MKKDIALQIENKKLQLEDAKRKLDEKFSKEVAPLEKAFAESISAAIEEHHKNILAIVKEAHDKLQEAINLSEKTGVAFCSSVSFMGAAYSPESGRALSQKEREVIEDITDISEWEIKKGNGWGSWDASSLNC